MTSRRTRPVVLAGAALAGALALTACGSSSSSSAGPSSGSATTTGTPSSPTTGNLPSVAVDSAAAAMVPAALKSAGAINVAADASYAPDEFLDASGKIVGMDVDLGTVLGQALGVPFKFANQSFDSILGTLGSRYDLGISSFTDTKAREQQVTMVDYFVAGESIMVNKGQHQDLTSLASLCGHTVGVEKGTTELDDATTQSKSCKLTIDSFDTETEVNQALASGRVEAAFADSPVNAYYAAQSSGQFEVVGHPFSTAPYGIAVPMGAKYQGLAQAIAKALTDLQASGTYTQVLDRWGIGSGATTSFTINGATS